ncbi:MAG: hypothetical protein HS113_27110 [Verrucomicrobiales bacterium]|nr:hypothetical protein [Verrucomicrobiales bacterium]
MDNAAPSLHTCCPRLPSWLAAIGIALGTVSGLGQAPRPITTLYGTGHDSSGDFSNTGSLRGDFHYAITPAGSVERRAVTLHAAAPNRWPTIPSAWAAAASPSAWISVNDQRFGQESPGEYVFLTRFSLSGMDPATARVTGRYLVDNRLLAIRLNGRDTPVPPGGGFTQWSHFEITADAASFRAGLNRLEFVVRTGSVPNPAWDYGSGSSRPQPCLPRTPHPR